MEKPHSSIFKMCLINCGFFGVFFAWGLFFANMSAVFTYVGAKDSQIALFWFAGPLAGIIVQPIIGVWSDWTWNKLGRRKPFMIFGSIIACIGLFVMVHVNDLFLAVSIFTIMMFSINALQGPYKALPADMFNSKQVSLGYIVQYIFVAAGSSIAYFTPEILSNVFNLSNVSNGGDLPDVLRISFIIGAIVFAVSMIITCVFVKEYPPEDIKKFREEKKKQGSLVIKSFSSFSRLFKMPKVMQEVSLAMFFAWLGIFLVFVYFADAVAINIFKAVPDTVLYTKGVEWAGFCFGMYSVFSLVFSFIMPSINKVISQKALFAITMLCGGISMICMLFVSSPGMLIVIMIGVGIMFAGNQSLPYAIIGEAVDKESMGVNMGIFNISLCVPQLMISLFFGFALKYLLGGNCIYALVVGGVFMLISVVFALKIHYVDPGKA